MINLLILQSLDLFRNIKKFHSGDCLLRVYINISESSIISTGQHIISFVIKVHILDIAGFASDLKIHSMIIVIYKGYLISVAWYNGIIVIWGDFHGINNFIIRFNSVFNIHRSIMDATNCLIIASYIHFMSLMCKLHFIYYTFGDRRVFLVDSVFNWILNYFGSLAYKEILNLLFRVFKIATIYFHIKIEWINLFKLFFDLLFDLGYLL